MLQQRRLLAALPLALRSRSFALIRNFIAFSKARAQIGDAFHSSKIFALSSGRRRAAIAVAPGLRPPACRAARGAGGRIASPRVASWRRCAMRRQPIDDAVALWFPGPRARPARTSPNSMSMAGARCWLRVAALAQIRGLRRPSPANSPGARSRTASSISPRPKVSTI